MSIVQPLTVAPNNKGGGLLASFIASASSGVEVSVVAATCATSLRPEHGPLRPPGTFTIFPRRNSKAELVLVRLFNHGFGRTTYSLIHILPFGFPMERGVYRGTVNPAAQERKVAEDLNYQLLDDGRLELVLGDVTYTSNIEETKKCDIKGEIVAVPAIAILNYLVGHYDEKRLARAATAHGKATMLRQRQTARLEAMRDTVGQLREELTAMSRERDKARDEAAKNLADAERLAEAHARDLERIRALTEENNNLRSDMGAASAILVGRHKSG